VKVVLLPLYFTERNERESAEYAEQMALLREYYGDVAEFLPEQPVGAPAPKEADAVVFPQMIFAAFRHNEDLLSYNMPMVVLTSRFGTVEMWDWEIVTYLRDLGLTVFSPYSVEMGKTVLRALGVKRSLKEGAAFLMFQDSPGEGMQANIFKRFYWWEKESTRTMEDTFGCRLIYRSWKALSEDARNISDDEARKTSADWNIHQEGVSEVCFLKAVKIYIAVKRVIAEIGDVAGVGANCLNESFYCDTTPCLAWNMLFERDNIIFACEGDTLTLLSTYILYRTMEKPIMMTNLYPFLVGMAALAHEKIDKFPEIEDPDNHALGVHCGYFGFVPRCFCEEWTLRPKVLEIVNEDALMVDARLPKGPVTLAKIYPGFKKLSVIKAEIEDYVQYPGSDCRNGALIRYRDGHKVMDALCSHHSLIISGDVAPELRQLARVFGWEAIEL
jgi:hypothetical protein